MTNKDIWDVLMEIYTSENAKNTTLVISSIDDHFNCYFKHTSNQIVYFRLTVQNSFFSDNTYKISHTYVMDNDDNVRNLSEKALKTHLIPIIRQAKLDLLGI